MNINACRSFRLAWARRIVIITILAVIPAAVSQGSLVKHSHEFEKNRAKLLSYIIGKQIETNHYYHKPIGDKLSQQAYDLYLKQVDPRKLFFLQKDVDILDRYQLDLDDEVHSGNVQFPVVAEELLHERVQQIKQFVTEIFAAKIDLDKRETLELERKKLQYCQSAAELKDRWRRNIKYQIAVQYLDLQEIAKAKASIKETSLSANGSKKILTNESRPLEKKKPEDLKKEAIKKVQKSNQELLKRMLNRDEQDEYDRFFSVLAKAVDPHSSFMPPSQKEDFDIHMRGSLEGIGAVLQEVDGYVKVVRIIPGGAAYRQKQLDAEDVILMVAQADAEPVDISGMKLRDAVTLIRGKKGSMVRLTVKKPTGTVTIIPIIRDVVQLKETFVKSVVLPQKAGEPKFGYIKIPSFYRDFQGHNGRNVTDDMRKALQGLTKEKIDGLIVDLRNNGGGALVDAVKIAGLFIDQGPVVQIKAKQKINVLSDTDPGISYDGPMIVMINRFSASASEIFAGAMQDYGRALIIGSEHSYGKGTVQTLINLDDNLPFFGVNMSQYRPLGALKLTTQKFYRINGGSTQDRGVSADIVLPDTFKYTKIGEKYSDNAMPWDKIASAYYKKWHDSPFNISALRSLNTKKIKSNKKFAEIIKEAEEAKIRQQHTLINIDLESLRVERDKLAKIREDAGDKPYINNPHGPDFDKKPDHEMTKAEGEKALVENLEKDPALLEVLALFRASLS